MKDYLIVIAITLILAWAIDGTRFGPANSLRNRNKNHIIIFLIFAVLALFIGLRTEYNDTFAYMHMYSNSVAFPDLWNSLNLKLGANPGFAILQGWLKSNGVSAQGFILLLSCFTVLCSLVFLKKYSVNLVITLFLFFATNAYTVSAAAVKQAIAISFGLLAVMASLNRKWILFAILMFVAATFHPYVLMYALVPFLTFKPWSGKTYVLLLGFLVVGFTLESLLGTIVDATSMIGDTYSEEDLIGEGISVFRVLVANVPLVLTFLYRRTLFRENSKETNVIINLALLNGAIMFVGIFGTAIYFSRMANYFTIAQCVALPWILSNLPRNHKQFFTGAMIAGYSGFFLYANVIAGSFSSGFTRITLWQYLAEYIFK